MEITTLNSFEEYTSDGTTVNLPITFSYLDIDEIHVYLDEVETALFVKDEANTRLILDAAPANGVVIKIQRETVKLVSTMNVEETYTQVALDRLISIIQEITVSQAATVAAPTSEAGSWVTATPYKEKALLVSAGILYRVANDYTSGASPAIDVGNGNLVSLTQTGNAGAQGTAGNTGATGGVGPQGAAGINGANGNDGIFTAIASQAQAQAGADNILGMTALRVLEAITALAPTALQTITDALDTKISTNISQITAAKSRLLLLESITRVTSISGSTGLVNAQAVPLEIRGVNDPGGNGDIMQVDGDGTFSMTISVMINRKTDLEERLVVVTLNALFHGGAWQIQRERTIYHAGNIDGLKFTVVNLADKVGSIRYTSDNMAGANYNATMKYVGREFPVGL